MCVLSEDGLSPGEAGGQSERLPQHLFPLLALQHQTQVRNKKLKYQETQECFFQVSSNEVQTLYLTYVEVLGLYTSLE